MKIISERQAVLPTQRGDVIAHIIEAATKYYVTIRPVGWQSPLIKLWPVEKGRHGAYNMLAAFSIAYNDARKLDLMPNKF